MSTWSEALTETIGREVARHRGERSAQWLADRTRDLGHQVSRTAVWELEAGKRKSVTVADLLVLARALDVPAVQLLFPAIPDGPTEVVPGVDMTALDAVRWVSGEGDLPRDDVKWISETDPVVHQHYTTAPAPDRFVEHPSVELLALCRELAAEMQATSRAALALLPRTPDAAVDADELRPLELDHKRRTTLLAQEIRRAGGVMADDEGADE